MQESEGGLTTPAWKLYEVCWQLLPALSQGLEGGVSATTSTGFEDKAQQGMTVAGFVLGPMPFSLEKHLGNLPGIGRTEG